MDRSCRNAARSWLSDDEELGVEVVDPVVDEAPVEAAVVESAAVDESAVDEAVDPVVAAGVLAVPPAGFCCTNWVSAW